jgi:hypothetical protein
MSEIIDNETGEVTGYEPVEMMSGAVAAEISQQVATAKRYPRRTDKAISVEIMSRATLDEETAAECCYSLPRAGKDIVGPSVRFAELVFASYGNMRAGARFVELDTKDPARAAVIIEGVCIDMQMNNGQTVPVRRSITGRKGIFNADMTNIAFSAGAAIARREAILKTVPKSIWGAAWKGVLAVLQGDQKTLATRRRSSVEAFQKMGVEPDRVFAALDVAGEEAITLEHMPRLIGMWTALRDGTETIDSLFGKPGPAHDVVKNPLKDDPATDNRPGKDDPPAERPATGKIADLAIDEQEFLRKAMPGPDPISSGISETIARNADKVTQGAQAMAQERSETASNDGAKSDKASGAAAEVTEQGSPDDGRNSPAMKEPAQTASPGSAKTETTDETPYDDAAGYMTFMRDSFDAATSKAAVTDLWGSTRADRNELLSPQQIDELTKDKEAKLRALKLKNQ